MATKVTTPVLSSFTEKKTRLSHFAYLLTHLKGNHAPDRASKSEVNTLREENAGLSRRLRTKKTRLREGGSMNLAEGQDREDQNEVDG